MTTCQLVFSPGAGKADCWELPFPCASQQRWGWQPFRWLNIHQTEFVCCFALLLCTLIASEFIVVLESALQDCELRLCALLEKMNDTTATLPEFNKWFGRGYWYCKRILRVTVWPKLFWGATTFSKACSFVRTDQCILKQILSAMQFLPQSGVYVVSQTNLAQEVWPSHGQGPGGFRFILQGQMGLVVAKGGCTISTSESPERGSSFITKKSLAAFTDYSPWNLEVPQWQFS